MALHLVSKTECPASDRERIAELREAIGKFLPGGKPEALPTMSYAALEMLHATMVRIEGRRS